jgi:microcompartment protein CcmK/EutM
MPYTVESTTQCTTLRDRIGVGKGHPIVIVNNNNDRRHVQSTVKNKIVDLGVVMILPQVHLRKPCYDFTFL